MSCRSMKGLADAVHALLCCQFIIVGQNKGGQFHLYFAPIGELTVAGFVVVAVRLLEEVRIVHYISKKAVTIG